MCEEKEISADAKYIAAKIIELIREIKGLKKQQQADNLNISNKILALEHKLRK